MTIGKINRNPDKPIFDFTDYEWLIEQWLADCLHSADTETVNGYKQRFTYFKAWWSAVGPAKDWKLSEEDFFAFEVHLRSIRSASGRLYAYNTRLDAIKRLRDMLSWAHRKGYTGSIDLSPWVVQPQGAAPVRRAATLEQLSELVKAASKTSWPARSLAILALLLGCGLRRREASARSAATEDSADSGDIDESDLAGLLIEKIVFYSGNSGLLTVIGKRTVANPTGERQVAFDEVVGGYLIAYLDEIGESSGPLLRNMRNKSRPLGHKGVYRTVKEIIRLAGLESVIDACHQLRRNYSHYWIKAMNDPAGADFLRRNLGHKRYSQTTEYVMIDAADILPYATSPLSLIRRSGR